MKMTEIPVEDNAYVKSILIADDGSVAILYKGIFSVFFKTRDEVILEPVRIGPSLQIRIGKSDA